MPKYKIEVGDYSHDGHSITEEFTVEVNKTAKQINAAYAKAEKKAKVSLTQESDKKIIGLFKDFGDKKLPKEAMERLEEMGVDFDKIAADTDDDEIFHCQPESAAQLYLEMAKTQLPDLEYKFVEEETLVNGIGYGLFHP